jgi:neopullulanase
MKKLTLLCLFWLITQTSFFAQGIKIQRIDPSNWWIGMKNQNLQLLVYGDNFKDVEVSIKYNGVLMESARMLENSKYMVIDLKVAPNTTPGMMPINFSYWDYSPKSKSKKKTDLVKTQQTVSYELKARNTAVTNKGIQGISTSDFMYLIMPDRFANAEIANDVVIGMQEEKISRDSLKYRHGGDLKGIQNKLSYVKELGVTALWLNPVVENDMPKESYHGYGYTDHYKVDPRLGGPEAYKNLIDACHAQGIKMIQDLVLNHVGDKHYLLQDLPQKDFLNQWDKYTNTHFRDEPMMDPYASDLDRKVFSDGWFVPVLSDLNQKNPIVANYLTQNAIWWVETFGIDAYRVDTYAYSDLKFEEKFFQALQDEYPKLGLFGETWVHTVPNQAFFTKNNIAGTRHNSTLPGVTDFQMNYAILNGLNENFGWTEGLNRPYRILAADFLYKDPNKNVTFLDNHDLSRFYSVIGRDINKYKMGLTLLLTTRGIPQMYYGTELLFEGFDIGGGITVRQDMPGGWSNDKVNKFEAKGRTAQENEAFNFVKKLANVRKNNAALHSGKLMQFVPENGIYTYFRYNQNQTYMVVLNQNKEAKTLDTKRFAERMNGFTFGTNVLTDETLRSLDNISVPAMGSVVIELKK